MGQNIEDIQLDSMAADPGSPSDGCVWYNSTEQAIKARLNGVTETLSTGDGSGDVTAAASIADNALVRGDGGAKGIQGGSNWLVEDDGLLHNTSISRVGYAMEVWNTKGDGGGGGLHVRGGETGNDIAMRIADADDTFTLWEVQADNGYTTLGMTYLAAETATPGAVHGIDNRHGAGVASDFNTTNGTYRIAGVDVVMPAGGTAGQVLTKVDGTDYNTQWSTPSGGGAPASNAVSASDAINTNNETWLLMPGMTLTPAAGTYMVFGAINGEHSNKNGTAHFTLYSGGVEIPDSEMQISGDGMWNGVPLLGRVTVNGSQAIEIRWKRDGTAGTVDVTTRKLSIIEVS